MSVYQEFLTANYDDYEKINILAFPDGIVKNTILQVDKLKKASGDNMLIDVYMSMNPLVVKDKHINRDKEHVGRLKWLYADLDYYHSCYKDFTKQQIIGLLEMDYYEKKIPVPTYVIDSGRGLYLLWRVDEHVKAYPRWVKMQKYLCDQLQEFGADRKVVSDSARVLRQIGSINSKSGTEVCVMHHQHIKYSLTNLMREYVVDTAPSPKMITYAKNIAHILEMELPDMKDRETVKKFIRDNKEPATLFLQMQKVKKRKKSNNKIAYIGTEYSLLYSRLQDLEKLLLKHRDQEGGYREYILFLYRYWQICVTNDKDMSLINTLRLNSRLKYPLEEKEVVFATKSAEKYYDAGKIYHCTNEHIIKALNITSEEMKDLSVFISPEESASRKRERNRKAYLSTLKKLGKLTKEAQIKQRQIKIYRLLKKGKTGVEICRQLNISRATFYADRHAIERYLAVKKEKEEKRRAIYAGYKKNMEEKCLKFSAFVLNMSFRTSCGLSSFGVGVHAWSVVAFRALRIWGAYQLSCSCSRFGYFVFDCLCKC